MSVDKEELLTDPVNQIICAKCGKPLDVAGLPAFSKFRCGHCHAVQTVPAKLGNFILLELLGRGGMGAVYRAVDQSLGRPVAIKVMLRSVAEDRLFFEQFKREARAAAALNHPNIVQIYSLDEEKGQSYIVMELLSGGRLDHIITHKKRVDEPAVLKIAQEVADGLNAASRVGLIHDDIKPENILFDGKGVAKIVDFGLARYRGKGGPQSAQNEIWGTPYYIAPEKVLRQTPDLRSDIYSLGATLFHALAGRPPFEGETAVDVVKARVQEAAPDIRTFRPDVRPEVAALLAHMLERDPAKRHPTYAALMEELSRLIGVEPGKTGKVEPAAGKSTKILIKGKKKSSRIADELTASAPVQGEAGETAAEPAKPKKAIGKTVKLVVGGLLALGLVAGGITGLVIRHRAKTTVERQQARLAKLKQQATERVEAIRDTLSPALTEAYEALFLDVEATNRLAKARGIVRDMGDSAKLVTVPAFPSDQDVADRAGAPAAASFNTVTNLEALGAEAEALADAIAGARVDAISQVDQQASRLDAIHKTVEPMARSLAESRKAGLKVVDEAQDWIAQAEKAREAGELAAAREAAKSEAEKKRLAAEAERKRLADEKAARIAAEVERVHEAWNDVQDALRQNEFADAGETLKRKLTRLDSDEAKAEAQRAVDKCQRLQELKEFLIESLQAKPLRWGWFTGSGQIDVSGASDKGVLVRGEVKPWTTVDARQMLRFIEYYVKSEDTREKKGKRLWASLHLDAAVYCHIQGEKGYALARAYANAAIDNDSRLEDEVKRLMPDLPKGE